MDYSIKDKLVKVFYETLYSIDTNDDIRKSTMDSIENSEIFDQSILNVPMPEPRYEKTNVILSKKKTIDAALEYNGKRVAIHNFASATTPGGGVRTGSRAQEESICRCTNLYPAISREKLMRDFYMKNREAYNPYFLNMGIYSPDILILRNDDSFTFLSVPSKVNVLTLPAPNLSYRLWNGRTPDKFEYREVMYKRIDLLFKEAIIKKADVLITGAFGCGAFHNPPDVVASIYNQMLVKYSGHFKTVEFAIFCNEVETQNYDAFQRTLSEFLSKIKD